MEGYIYTFIDDTNTRRTVELGKVLFRSHGIIGRGTIVIRVLCLCSEDSCECEWKGRKLIMKISFPSEGRISEAEIIR